MQSALSSTRFLKVPVVSCAGYKRHITSPPSIRGNYSLGECMYLDWTRHVVLWAKRVEHVKCVNE